MNPDRIHLRGLRVPCNIGVPDEERASFQCLVLDLVLESSSRFEEMEDEVDRTIDYEAVANFVRKTAAGKERKLIETLAADLAESVLTEFAPAAVEIEIRKFILPGTDHVAVSLRREKRG